MNLWLPSVAPHYKTSFVGFHSLLVAFVVSTGLIAVGFSVNMGSIEDLKGSDLSDPDVIRKLKSSLTDSKVLTPGSEEYDDKSKRWSEASEKRAVRPNLASVNRLLILPRVQLSFRIRQMTSPRPFSSPEPRPLTLPSVAVVIPGVERPLRPAEL